LSDPPPIIKTHQRTGHNKWLETQNQSQLKSQHQR
jgi:hypothetical protein